MRHPIAVARPAMKRYKYPQQIVPSQAGMADGRDVARGKGRLAQPCPPGVWWLAQGREAGGGCGRRSRATALYRPRATLPRSSRRAAPLRRSRARQRCCGAGEPPSANHVCGPSADRGRRAGQTASSPIARPCTPAGSCRRGRGRARRAGAEARAGLGSGATPPCRTAASRGSRATKPQSLLVPEADVGPPAQLAAQLACSVRRGPPPRRKPSPIRCRSAAGWLLDRVGGEVLELGDSPRGQASSPPPPTKT